jgi:putative PIN family toxin of toxin-antitoxin system
VLDTNVLVSGLLNPRGAPGRIQDALLAGTIAALFDDRIMAEYRDVLARPIFGFQRTDVESLLDYIESTEDPTTAPPLSIVLPDPDDLPFLEVAAAGRADALVTGNVRHFKPLRGHHSVTINTPAEFLARLKASLT